MSSSSVETNLLEEERRAFEEMEQFEQLERECAMNRRGIRVKFDDERLPSMAQTTIVKSEPYFQINSTEDQVTKHFYHNEFPLKDLDDEQNQQSTENSVKTLSEMDSLEDVVSSSPGRSILKKSLKKRQPSPSPHSDSNEMVHLAEVTGKQIHSQPSCPVRSLFEPTINIFDSSPLSNQSRRPSRLRYYIKPYRGDTYIPPESNKQRSRSLSEQRIAQQSGPTVWYTFTNQYNRKHHVSWSPVRDYIHQGRDKTSKEQHQNKLSKQSSNSSPCLRTSSSSSVTPVYSPQYEENKPMNVVSSLPDLVHPPPPLKKKHTETMQRYDRLLEKMRATDEQLQTLSRTWTTNLKQRTTVCRHCLS